MANFRNKAITQVIEHLPCCLLSAGAGLIGLSALNHNPMLELGFALGGAIAGEHIGHNLAKKFNWEHDCGGPLASKKIIGIPKDYLIAISIGLITWGGHQVFFHDHTHERTASATASADNILTAQKTHDHSHHDHAPH